MTPEEAREAWVAALRSGDYEQGKRHLRWHYKDHDEFCCLGVACELAIDDGVPIERRVPSPSGAVTYNRVGVSSLFKSHGATLPSEVVDWLGLRNGHGTREHWVPGHSSSLAAMNDRGTPFDQIADAIENEPEAFFFVDNQEAA